ncbi:LysR family transcriptional regulator [Pseudooceanicola nanhaiensis]|uniref:LysR family transcriptional regulator n=1 Tax=Pseudooceanicola nanhaiensis TaxID=375761 RepID=UPI001CD1A458|nr:LysR family transcriptional regulator [Pseudooceanicola nanhaiensis]MCA0920791.1 LysR family transcriptional regulator [Pseudooceanicola nanhaiensis]
MTAPPLPNLRHLAGIVAIAEGGTMSAAAERLNLSQPALAQGLAKAESSLGAALFLRNAKGMQPTEAGQIFAARLLRGFAFLRMAGPLAQRDHLDRLVTLNQMQSLIAAVDHGGMRAAAVRMGRAASSVSRACRELEAQTGALFDHGRPTRQAEELARVFKLALNEFRQGQEDVLGLQGVAGGRLAIGCLPLVQAMILPEALNRFAPEFPAVAPQVVDGDYDSLVRGLWRGDLDMLVGALRPEGLPDQLVQMRLFSDELLVVARPGHPLAGLASVRLVDLARYPWIAPRVGAPARGYFEAMQSVLKPAPELPLPIETGAHSVMRGLLMGSDRLTVTSRLQVQRDIAQGLMVPIHYALSGSGRDIGVTHVEGWLPSVPQARFLEILRQVVGELT